MSHKLKELMYRYLEKQKVKIKAINHSQIICIKNNQIYFKINQIKYQNNQTKHSNNWNSKSHTIIKIHNQQIKHTLIKNQ